MSPGASIPLRDREWRDVAGIALVIVVGLAILAPGLGHPMIVSWDEGAHQAVTRGLRDTWTPVIYRDPLVPISGSDWFNAGVFLHKPTLPFLLGALVMRIIGVTPLALRAVSLGGEIAAAVVIYLVARRDLGRWLGLLLSTAFLALPFGWQLVQGVQFGDVTDCSLVGFLSLSFWWLVRAVERERILDAALAGAACGLALLCKSALAITPLGAAGVLWLLQLIGFLKGLSGRQVLAVGLATTAVSLPYNLYCEHRWPGLFWRAVQVTWSHLSTGVGSWGLPIDALFNQVGSKELGAAAMGFFLISGLWLLRVAVRDRTAAPAVAALWLWGEWIPLSYARAKVPATMWGAVPAMLVAAGYFLKDARRSPAVALAAVAALASPWLVPHWPRVLAVRSLVPVWLPQTRSLPGLAEGLALAAFGAIVGFLLRHRFASTAGALAVASAALAFWGVNGRHLGETISKEQARFPISFTRELGLALDQSLPERSILFLDFADRPACCAEKQNLMFWSGRMVYPRKPELLALARERGYHPYLISNLAQPFARVTAVPASAWLQAFDLDQPLEPKAEPALPADLRGAESGPFLGLGVGESVAGRGRYALYLRANGLGASVPVTFETREGKEDARTGTATPHDLLTSAPWIVLPAVGPLPEDLVAITVGAERVTLGGK